MACSCDVSERDEQGPWVVVGLGNPGDRYAGNRHNVGAMVVAELADRRGEKLKAHKSRTSAATCRFALAPGQPPAAGVLAVPNEFMNLSGGPTKALVGWFGSGVDRLIVVHDELDIPFDSLKLKVGGGHGGHNGIRDVAKALGTADFPRVRVGIGRPPGRQDPADWVLDPFSSAERTQLPLVLDEAADAVEQLIGEGLLAAQQRHHAPRA